jgi:hypothetical protein
MARGPQDSEMAESSALGQEAVHLDDDVKLVAHEADLVLLEEGDHFDSIYGRQQFGVSEKLLEVSRHEVAHTVAHTCPSP